MVSEPGLTVAPSNPATSQQVKTRNTDGNCTDDAERVSRFTETTCLPYT